MPDWIANFIIVGAMGMVLLSAVAVTKLCLTAMLWCLGDKSKNKTTTK